jgi:hypothetical protein
MNTLRFGVLTTVQADGQMRYVIVDTYTNVIVDGGFLLKQPALDSAAYLVLCNEVPEDEDLPTAEELGLQFPDGDDLHTAWQDHFRGTEEGA